MNPERPSLDADSLISIWETSSSRHPIVAALDALDIAARGAPATSFASLPLGTRDAALLALRADVLGDVIEATTACPACGTVVETTLSCAELLASDRPVPEGWTIRVKNFAVELRPITSTDAMDAAMSGDQVAARALLLERAVRRVHHPSGQVTVSDLPRAVVESIVTSLSERDPAAEYLLELQCPSCRHLWTDLLDIAPFVLSELRNAARQLLETVDLLAKNYGWSEASILALSPVRRSAYAALAMG
jgi:hypothetical protein